MPRPLTDMQARFVAELSVDGDPVAAALRAGYSDSAAQRVHHTLLKKPHVRAQAEPALAARAARRGVIVPPADATIVDVHPSPEPAPRTLEAQVLAEWVRIAFADIRSVVKWDTVGISDGRANRVTLVSSHRLSDDEAAAIAEISQSKAGGVRVKLHDKLSALDKIARHLGMLSDGASSPTVTINNVTVSQVRQELEEIFERAAARDRHAPADPHRLN